MNQVWVSSCYRFKTRKPLVNIHYQDTVLQISAAEARDLAGHLIMVVERIWGRGVNGPILVAIAVMNGGETWQVNLQT